MIREWKLNPASQGEAKAIEDKFESGKLAARVLAARGCTLTDAESIFGDSKAMEDPFALKDMDKAADRIRSALESGETIAVFGDYDVDGVTATALMYTYLSSAGGSEVIVRLPERKTEGYGLSKTAVQELCSAGTSLIITVDNGIAAYDEIELANSLGVDVVVCDHHIAPEKLPNAVAVVDPHRADCGSTFKELAGVGVALKLAAAVEGCEPEQIVDFFGYFAALGTVADVVPLVGENRYIVKAGIEQIKQDSNAGLTALLECASIPPERLTSRLIAFGLAPRLNAAGRIGSAADSLELLLNEENAQENASKINALNEERRRIETEIQQRIEAVISVDPEIVSRPIIVVGDSGFSGGVIGIVASRLTEQYGKPAIVYCDDGTLLKGSCRSVEGFSIYDALSFASDALLQFGGHAMAAGLSLEKKELGHFISLLCDYCALHPVPHSILHIDCVVAPDEITAQELHGLSRLEPFGRENEQPVFAVRGMEIIGISPIAGKYTQYTLSNRQSDPIRIADFRYTVKDCPYRVGDRVDAAFIAGINESFGREYVSLRAVELRAFGFLNSELQSMDIYNSLNISDKWNEKFAEIAPTREEVGRVYRVVCEPRYNSKDITPLILRCGLPAGKVSAALRILDDIGLVNMATLRVPSNPQKRSLADSPTFEFLTRGGN